MDTCITCQDFKINVGHDSESCPANICKKCGQTGHVKFKCMAGFENLPLPNEIIFKILSYLEIQDLYRCSQTSKRIRGICLSDQLKNNSRLSEVLNLMHETTKSGIIAEPTELIKDWHPSVESDRRNHLIIKL